MCNVANLATISTHCGHIVAQRHNRRDPAIVMAEHHIDLNRTHENWIDIDERIAYSTLFDRAQEEYNARQKRKDRRITDYYASIRNPYDAIRKEQHEAEKWNSDYREEIKRGELEAKVVPKIPRTMKKPSNELIIGVYRKEQRFRTDGIPVIDKDGNPVYDNINMSEEEAKPILEEYFKNWQTRNPHLYCFGCYYHADERGSAPHLHIDFIPWADGYKKGMERQLGLDRALQQQGFTSDGVTGTAIEKWTQFEREYLEEIVTIHGYGVIHPQSGKGVAHKTKYELQRDELKRDSELLQQKIDEQHEQIAELNGRIVRLRSVSAQASGEAYEEIKRRDEAKMETERMKRIKEQEATQIQAMQAQANQIIADYIQKIDELQAEHEADVDIREKRAVHAARHAKMRDGQPVLDYFADYYERNANIPRIPEDEAYIEVHKSETMSRIGDLSTGFTDNTNSETLSPQYPN